MVDWELWFSTTPNPSTLDLFSSTNRWPPGIQKLCWRRCSIQEWNHKWCGLVGVLPLLDSSSPLQVCGEWRHAGLQLPLLQLHGDHCRTELRQEPSS